MEMRTKTIKALSAQAELINMNAAELIAAVEASIKNFVSLDEEAAYNLMLRLKLTPGKEGHEENAATSLEDVLKEAGLENIGNENVQKVCGDMAAAYKEAHPGCWLTKKEEYPEELRKTLQDDATLMYFIYSKCKEASYLAVDSVKRIIFLTTSEEEKFRFGGLRAMFFSQEQAACMKDFANTIGNYFKSFVEDKLIVNEEAPAETPLPGDPLTDESEPKSQAMDNINSQDAPANLTAIQVLNNAEVLNTFFNAYKALEKAGIDPKAAIEKMDSVEKLLNAATEL